MSEQIKTLIEQLSFDSIPSTRKKELIGLAQVIKNNDPRNEEINLNFICTHNSRRSQFAQVWAQTMAYYHNYKVNCYSGGVEITACNPRTIDALKSCGFDISKQGDHNPKYTIKVGGENETLTLFSKRYSDDTTPQHFIAVMTCDHADQNCPFIPNAVARIPLTYIDPKRSDDTPNETITYYNTSVKIATEMKYLFSQL